MANPQMDTVRLYELYDEWRLKHSTTLEAYLTSMGFPRPKIALPDGWYIRDNASLIHVKAGHYRYAVTFADMHICFKYETVRTELSGYLSLEGFTTGEDKAKRCYTIGREEWRFIGSNWDQAYNNMRESTIYCYTHKQ